MTKIGEIKEETRGRPGIDPAYKMKVYEIAIRNDLWGKPKRVLELLGEWKKTREKEIAQGSRKTDVLSFYSVKPDKPEGMPKLPTKDTVQRLLKKLQSEPFMHNPAQREYHYPTSSSYADAIDPSTPLACLRFYQDKYDVRPSVGLVRWFCEMAAAIRVNFTEPDEESIGTEAFQVAVFAEACWLAELIESLGEPKPDLTVLETKLAWRSWEFGTEDQNTYNDKWRAYANACKKNGFTTDAPLVNIPVKFWLLASDMPAFMAYKQRRGGEGRL